MAHIVFKARKDGNVVSAETAKEAVRLFLTQFKNRQFHVSEYRDGVFVARLYVAPGEQDDSCFYRSFKSREEARAFCEEA